MKYYEKKKKKAFFTMFSRLFTIKSQP